jgi:hypothetical protein
MTQVESFSKMCNDPEFVSKLHTKRTYSSKNKYISTTLGRALKIRGIADKNNMVRQFWEYQYQNITDANLNYFTRYVYDPTYRVLYCDWADHNNNELSEILYDWVNHRYWYDKIKNVLKWKTGVVVYLAFSRSFGKNGINIYWSKTDKKINDYHPDYSLKINADGDLTDLNDIMK